MFDDAASATVGKDQRSDPFDDGPEPRMCGGVVAQGGIVRCEEFLSAQSHDDMQAGRHLPCHELIPPDLLAVPA
ncbi:hypothetical protein GCM10009839_78540 [Catenulispora yoronensis]|uniref:Uncharacterized protein n=1 Tax=Catenulispora yoronensis TaxID=450799 RepID=A0ABP5GU52_9ACTN